MNSKSLISGIALGVAASGVFAGEGFSTLNGIPTETMSHSEMVNVEGKSLLGDLLLVLVARQLSQTNRTFTPEQRPAYQTQVARFNNAMQDFRKPISYEIPKPVSSLPTGLCRDLSCALNVVNTITPTQSIFSPFYGINPNLLQGIRYP